jgi:hypothetical protein
MSLQDFILGVLASIVAAIICTLSKYAHLALKKFLDINKALSYQAISKMHSMFNYYEKYYLAAIKISIGPLARNHITSPVILSLILYSLLMVFAPLTVNRNEEHVIATIEDSKERWVFAHSENDELAAAIKDQLRRPKAPFRRSTAHLTPASLDLDQNIRRGIDSIFPQVKAAWKSFPEGVRFYWTINGKRVKCDALDSKGKILVSFTS